MEKYRQVVRMTHMFLGWCKHDVKVTRIGDGYNIRIYTNDTINQEARTMNKCDIGHTIASLLRWEDKCGNWSDMAISSRRRLNKKLWSNV